MTLRTQNPLDVVTHGLWCGKWLLGGILGVLSLLDWVTLTPSLRWTQGRRRCCRRMGRSLGVAFMGFGDPPPVELVV